MNHAEFDSEFCNVRLIQEDEVVLLTWKKFCCYDDYRKPTMHGLELLRKNPSCDFVIDARNGFEDEKDDVVWAFAELLPAMAQTGCQAVAFFMNVQPDIEEEMDMWSRELSKYFAVYKTASYEEAVERVKRARSRS